MRKVRENILVTSGNRSIFAASKPVFKDPGANGSSLNGILDGQLVVYDKNTGISLGTTATFNNSTRIVVAVGHDTNGDGMADVLRKVYGDVLYSGNIQAATAEPPRCGVENVIDAFFKCVHCNESFGIEVKVEDDITQNQYPYNRPASYPYSVTTDCCECDSCEDGIDANKLACALVDQINNNVGVTDARNQSVFTKLAQRAPELPFYAVRLFGGHARATLDYCFNPITNTCDNCIEVEGIKGLSFTHPVNGVTTYTFTDSVSPDNADRTLIGQLAGIIEQINEQLDGFGSAILTSSLDGSGRACCPYKIQVNTCATDFQLVDDEDANMTPCATSDPFTAIPLVNNCKDCAAPTADNYTPVAGIRFVAKPVTIDCNCDTAPDTPRGSLTRKLSINLTSGFACGSTYVKEVQAQTVPENLGYEWQTREANAANGGSGRNFNPWGQDPHGRWGSPLDGSRGKSHKSVCKEMYCSYILEHTIPESDFATQGAQSRPRGRSVVLIPSGDTVTRTEFETLMGNLLGSYAPFNYSLTCASDTDQTELTLDQAGDVDQAEIPNTGGGVII